MRKGVFILRNLSLLTIALLLLLTNSVFAAPIADFACGKTSIDLGITQQKLETANSFWNYTPNKWDEKYNFDFATTIGLGEKFALQYKYQDIDATMPDRKINSDMQALNLLYRIDNTLHAFVGAQRLSGNISVTDLGFGRVGIRDTTRLQVGITGMTKLSEKLNGWATVAAGNDIKSFEAGIGYPLSKDVDINLFYRYLKIEDFELDSGILDSLGVKFKAEKKGFGLGVTLKI